MMLKISPNFYLHEFVPRIIYNKYGNNAVWFIRPELIKLADFIRNWFGKPMYINNWYWGGPMQNRGYRTPNTTIGSLYSQHKMGAAIDFNIKDLHPDKIRQEILDNEQVFMGAGLTTLEDGAFAPTWVHADIRNTELDYILIVTP